MPSAPPQRTLAALCVLSILGLGLLFWSSLARPQPPTVPAALTSADQPLAAATSAVETPDSMLGSSPPAREQAPASAPAEPLDQAGADFRLRFLLGSGGLGAADLLVELAALETEPVQAGQPTIQPCAGRTDAQGFLRVPSAWRERGFSISVRTASGQQRWPQPAALSAAALATTTDGPPEVQIFGPWAVIEARVLDEQRRPVSGARVQFDFESPAIAFSTRDASSTLVNSDGEGWARLTLLDPASVGGRLRLKARDGEENFSAELELPPPLADARVELILSTTAGAILRIAGEGGRPLPGAMARIERLDPPFASSGRSTDLAGKAKFKPLEPGRYAASAQDPSTGSTVRTEFELFRCQLADVQLQLPPSELPLALAGSVRTQDGRPVTWHSVSVCVEGREEARLSTDAEGRFRYHRAPCERLRVRLRTSFDGPQVEPELYDAAFGKTDVQFVLSDAPRLGFVALRVVERDGGAPLAGAAVVVFRDGAAERIGGVVSALSGSPLHLGTDEQGVVSVPSGPQLPRAQLIVEKRGFMRRELELADVALLPTRDGAAVLELERGWLQRWVVLDQRTGKPISGAIATHGIDPFTGSSLADGSSWPPSAPSDSNGVLELQLPKAPKRISIQAAGYQPQALDVLPGAGPFGGSVSITGEVLLEALARKGR